MLASDRIKMLMEFWLALVKETRVGVVQPLARVRPELAPRVMQPVAHRPVSENRPARAKWERLGLAVRL
jgi:hypothetical protein